MTLEILGISVLWLFLFGYVIVASIDFGSGFFNAYATLVGRDHILSHVIQRYLSPVWEVTNVFLVFFFVGIIGFFPKTAFYFGTTLLIPASISIVLLAIRGSYYAFSTYGGTNKPYTYLYGVVGLLIPASLSTVFTISEGGFVEMVNGNPSLNYWALFSSRFSWIVVALSLIAVLYISAVFLSWYAHKAKDIEAREMLRKYALIWAIPMSIVGIGFMVELRLHNPDHFAGILDLWWVFALSFICFIGTVVCLLRRRNYVLGFVLLVVQFGLAFFAYGAAHLPYLMYPFLTIYDGFTNEAMAYALIIAFVAGLCLLIPSLYLLLRLFLFDKKYVKGE